MEKFLLRAFLAGDELDIIHRQKIRLPVFFLEFRGGAVADGQNQLICKFLSLDVQKLVVGVVLPDAPADGIDQMGLAQAAAAVQEQGVIAFGGVIGHRPCGGVRQAVAAAHHEGLEGIFLFRDELRLFRGGGGLPDGGCLLRKDLHLDGEAHGLLEGGRQQGIVFFIDDLPHKFGAAYQAGGAAVHVGQLQLVDPKIIGDLAHLAPAYLFYSLKYVRK